MLRRFFASPAALPVLVLLLLAELLASLGIGRYPISLADIVPVLVSGGHAQGQGQASPAWVVLTMIRAPRVLTVAFGGMALAMAGAAAQGVFRNPLVSPEIMGVSSGAALGGVVAILLSWPGFGVTVLAFLMGFAALIAAVALAQAGGRSNLLALVLAGVIVAAFVSAVTGLIEFTADPQSRLPSIVYWLLGSFAGATYAKLVVISAAVLLGGSGLLALSWRINILALGDLDAQALGVRSDGLRWAVLALIALLVAAQVAVSGIVGWVGLLVPHLARVIVGPNHVRLLPASALLGAIFLLAMDGLSRGILASEVPIGLLTAMVGAPVFAAIFYLRQKTGWADA